MPTNIVDKSRRNDRLAAWLIKAGGLFVIIAVIGILVLIGQVALPLFYSPTAEKLPEVSSELSSLVSADLTGGFQTRELPDSGGSISIQLLPG